MKRRILTAAVLMSVFVSCMPMRISAQELNEEPEVLTNQEENLPEQVGGDDPYPLAEGDCGENVRYELDHDGNLRIYGTGDMENYTYEDYGSSGFPSDAPGWYNHHSEIKNVVIESGVTSIGKAAFMISQNLESITIPEGVTKIGAGAFLSCGSLKEINLPESLQSIGTFAFENCDQLAEMYIPASVTEIGERAFKYCYALTGVTVASGNTAYSSRNGILFNKAQTELVFCPMEISGDYTVPATVTEIGNFAFEDCRDLTAIDLPAGLVRIGICAFYNCSSATRIDIPSSVKEIGEYAFYDCGKITSAYIPEGITEIGNNTFFSCDSLADVQLPESLKKIGNYAFNLCYMIREIDLPESLTEIGNNAFSSCGFSSIVIPSNVTKIGDGCFNSAFMLSDVTLPESLESIGANAFANCNQLTAINIPDHVKSLGAGVFTGSKQLAEIHLPAELENLGSGAFANCEALTEIAIPDGVKTIGNNTFASCTALTEVTLPEELESIGNYAFSECTALHQLIIPDSVTSIGEYAFALCYYLQEVKIPASLTSLGKRAFHMCSSLPRISLPDGLTVLEEYTFYECTSLAEVRLSRNLTSIGYYAFSGCTSLKTITLPAGLETIVMDAFRSCSGLKSIVLPVSCVRIGPRAFSGCSSLTDVYYTGSEDRYEAMLLDDRWDTEWNDYFYHADWHFDYAVIEVNGISLSADSLAMGPGTTAKLTTSVSPAAADQTVLWTSSDQTVATVDSTGIVTAVSKGTSRIIASAGGYTAECKVTVQNPINIESVSLALKEKIEARFYVYVPDEEVDTTDIKITFNGETATYHAGDITPRTFNGKPCRIVSAATFAKQMRDEIRVTVTDTETGDLKILQYKEEPLENNKLNYKIEDYVRLAGENSTDEKLIDLVHKMDNYGKYAQIQFNDYNRESFTEPDDIPADYDDGRLEQYAAVNEDKGITGIEFSAVSLELESDSGVRVYYKLTGSDKIGDYTFTIDGNEATPVKKGSLYYVAVKGIPARLMHKPHTAVVTDKDGKTLSTEFSALTYVGRVIANPDAPESLKNLVRSIDLYAEAALTYFGED